MSKERVRHHKMKFSNIDPAGSVVSNYRLHESDAEEPWLTHALTASYLTYTSVRGGSSQSEGWNAEKTANTALPPIPVKINKEQNTITLHGTWDDIEYATKIMNARGFAVET